MVIVQKFAEFLRQPRVSVVILIKTTNPVSPRNWAGPGEIAKKFGPRPFT
jgi:hypothetical protein